VIRRESVKMENLNGILSLLTDTEAKDYLMNVLDELKNSTSFDTELRFVSIIIIIKLITWDSAYFTIDPSLNI
jgi:hypothetical protein